MEKEQFEYKEKNVNIKMMQPLTGGWLWQTDIDNVRLESPRRAPIKYRQDALQYATLEAKESIDNDK